MCERVQFDALGAFKYAKLKGTVGSRQRYKYF